MSQSAILRETRSNTIINDRSKIQEYKMIEVITAIHTQLHKDYGLTLGYDKRIKLVDIINILKLHNPNREYANVKDTTFLAPDGGMTYLIDKKGNKYPILIAEAKTQGTNTKRLAEGKKKQAQGNAVERLGKNVLGIKSMMSNENYMPFVCFGEGCDFAVGSSIIDRVHTIACFKPINKIDTDKDSMGSFFFREEKWSFQEQYDIMLEIACKGIEYYRKKYGKIFI